MESAQTICAPRIEGLAEKFDGVNLVVGATPSTWISQWQFWSIL